MNARRCRLIPERKKKDRGGTRTLAQALQSGLAYSFLLATLRGKALTGLPAHAAQHCGGQSIGGDLKARERPPGGCSLTLVPFPPGKAVLPYGAFPSRRPTWRDSSA